MTETDPDRSGDEASTLPALKDVSVGRYIEIGARRREGASPIQAFYDRGWSGISVEPEAEAHARLLSSRPRDLNLLAVVVPPPGGEGSAPAGATGDRGHPVAARAMTLAEVYGRAPSGDIHVLTIDAGVSEPQVLDGADFRTFRPWIVVIGSTARNGGGPAEAGWRARLSDAGYDCASSDGSDLVFRARERRDPAAPEGVPPAREPAPGEGAAPGDRLRALEVEHAAALSALARARQDLDALQTRFAQDARINGDAVQRLRGEARDAQARAASLETLLSDSLRLREVAALLDGRSAGAVQNHGLGVLQRSLAGQITAWMTEVARDRAELLLRLAAESRQRDLIVGSTSWRVTGPLRRIGRASTMLQQQPHRVPALVMRKLRRSSRLPPSEAASPSAAPSSTPDGQADVLAATAARIDGELTLIAELLQTLSAAVAGRGGGSRPATVSPDSEAYRTMTHAGKLAAWIRHDAARQRATAP